MTFNRLCIYSLAATLVVATIPTVALPTAAVAAGQECGWSSENGKLIFLGTCAHENGESSEPTEAPPASNPCIGKLTGGPVYSYRIELADCT